ncbi:hypothetical protein DAPPUDRAFT_245402 [Daphnia pulex]|uniref:Ionotropic glutamate receptor C-terminal domain-containing protein n=1 Tax=Daphnia pulex TaxID=6669 RepID=E9GNA1_DAPPU|nr:hypothetical protein DAPPUDRAFT_245402 [Daphnia pulex]|eukprot:EFX79069.1 hypothetical protein DAPPUDRAFT_245402 [Daphnia pulex]
MKGRHLRIATSPVFPYAIEQNYIRWNNFLSRTKCDLVMGAIAMTNIRLPVLDFSQGYYYTGIAFMIPMPGNSNNVAAVVKPFQLPVWIAILTILPCVLAALYFSNRYREIYLIEQPSSWLSTFFFYVFGVLLNQGAYCPDRRLFIRLIAITWCLAAFVLVSSYNSLLISYVTSPNAQPLINSMADLPNSSVEIVVDAGQAIDYVLSALLAALDAMKNDFLTTGKCDLTLARQKEPGTPGTWVLTKNSPYTEYISRGILEMFANGLLDIWTRWYQPDVRHCLDKANKIIQLKPSKNNPPQLSLTNLTGAFVVLFM